MNRVLFTISNNKNGKTFIKTLPIFMSDVCKDYKTFDRVHRVYSERYYQSDNIDDRIKYQNDHYEIFYGGDIELGQYLTNRQSCVEDVCILYYI